MELGAKERCSEKWLFCIKMRERDHFESEVEIWGDFTKCIQVNFLPERDTPGKKTPVAAAAAKARNCSCIVKE